MLSDIPTALCFEERTVFRQRILVNGYWTFELGIESGKILSSWVIVRFADSDEFDEETRNNSACLPVSSAVCRLGSDRYPDNSRIFDYPRTNFYEDFYEVEISFFLSQTHLR